MKTLLLASAILLTSISAHAATEGRCYFYRTGQFVSFEQFFTYASQLARSSNQCITAATSSAQIGAYQFDASGAQLDPQIRIKGCLTIQCAVRQY